MQWPLNGLLRLRCAQERVDLPGPKRKAFVENAFVTPSQRSRHSGMLVLVTTLRYFRILL